MKQENSKVNQSTLVKYVLIQPEIKSKPDFTLECGPINQSIGKIVWYKDSTLITNQTWLNQVTIIEKPNQSQLEIKANASFVGDYRCVWENQTVQKYCVRIKPQVTFGYPSLTYSDSVFLGRNWSLSCRFRSVNHSLDANLTIVRCESPLLGKTPLPCLFEHLTQIRQNTIDWLKVNTGRVGLNTSQVNSASLTISNVSLHDRALYVCISNNVLAHTNTTLLLRVDDPLYFLWPSILILTMALYLLPLIIVYDARRLKPMCLLKDD